MPQTEKHFSRKEIMQYHNHDLFIDVMIEVEQHLEICDECRNLAEETKEKSRREEINQAFDEETERIRLWREKQQQERSNSKTIVTLIVAILLIATTGLSYYLYPSIFEPVKSLLVVDEYPNSDVPLVENKIIITSDTIEYGTIDDSVTYAYLNQLDTLFIDYNPVEITARSQQLIRTVASSTPTITPSPSTQRTTTDTVSQVLSNANTATPVIEEPQEVVLTGQIRAFALASNQASPAQGYPNLNQYIANNINYPEEALNGQLSGDVEVTFSLSDNGINNIRITKSLSPACDQVVRNILQNGPSWQSFVGEDFVQYSEAQVRFRFTLSNR